MEKQITIALRVCFVDTNFTPSAELVYEQVGRSQQVPNARVVVDGIESTTTASNAIQELALRYPEKHVNRVELTIGDKLYTDTNGDGWVDFVDGVSLVDRARAYEIVKDALAIQADKSDQPQVLYDLIPDLRAKNAEMFRASCGSIAGVVHALWSHSLLWASVPPGNPPNEVHRHLGGNVYCVFYSGKGRFHRIDPQRGFETIPIEIDDSNPFQMIAIPTHLWYQPVNDGVDPLLYFMIHEPGFEQSEMLSLDESECDLKWAFEL